MEENETSQERQEYKKAAPHNTEPLFKNCYAEN